MLQKNGQVIMYLKMNGNHFDLKIMKNQNLKVRKEKLINLKLKLQ